MNILLTFFIHIIIFPFIILFYFIFYLFIYLFIYYFFYIFYLFLYLKKKKKKIELLNNESNISSPATSPITLNLSSNNNSPLDMNNNNPSLNQIPTFMNPLNNFNSVFNMSSNTSLSSSPSQSQNQHQNQPLTNSQTATQYSSEITSQTIHSGNSVNSGINTALFNSPSFAKDYQKQQVFFQNNVQYNGKIYKLDPLNNSGYIQLSDEVISVLLNDTRNEGKSFELIKSYLVYFSYSDVEVSHLKNMKVGDNASFKVKMTFIAPNNTNNAVSNPLDIEDNSITQAFDIFIKNKSNIPPDVLEMMKMMENIF